MEGTIVSFVVIGPRMVADSVVSLFNIESFIMPNKKSKTSKIDEFVPILFADSMEEAEEYCQLLEDHGIKTSTEDSGRQDDNNGIADGKADDDGDTYSDDMSHGVPVFVHKSNIDEANEIISEHDDLAAFGLDDDEFDDDEADDDFGMGPDTGDDEDLYDFGDDLDEIL